MPGSDSDATDTRILSIDEVNSLAEKLLDCPYIQDLEARQVIIGGLSPQIAGSIRHHSDDQIHVTRIVKACSNYTLGLQELMYRLHTYEKDSLPMKVVEDEIEALFPGVVTYELYYMELKGIIKHGHWTNDFLKDVYEASSLSNSPLPEIPDKSEMLSSLLDHLAVKVKQTDGSLPLLNFIAHLAQRASGESISGELIKWVNKTAIQRGVKNPLENKEDIQSRISPFIQIALIQLKIPNDGKKNPFIVVAWFGDEPHERSPHFYHTTIETANTTTLKSVFTEILDKGEGLIKNKLRKSVLELFLPGDLLHVNLDRWLINVGGSQFSSVSKEYPVVLRSLDRAMSQQEIMLGNWKRYWGLLNSEDLKKRTDGIIQLKVLSKAAYEKEKGNFFDTLRGVLNQGAIPAFAFVPKKAQLRDIIIAVGTPVAFWLRQQPDNFDQTIIEKKFETLLSNQKFAALPQLIWEERMRAMSQGDTQNLTHYLTLLWDDPNRIPLDLDAFTSSQPSLSRGINGERLMEPIDDLERSEHTDKKFPPSVQSE